LKVAPKLPKSFFFFLKKKPILSKYAYNTIATSYFSIKKIKIYIKLKIKKKIWVWLDTLILAKGVALAHDPWGLGMVRPPLRAKKKKKGLGFDLGGG
jgi:hypothetical protein